MKEPAVMVKCCVCGREKTPQGWRYTFQPDGGARAECSHGFCEACYAAEVMKVRLRAAGPALAVCR